MIDEVWEEKQRKRIEELEKENERLKIQKQLMKVEIVERDREIEATEKILVSNRKTIEKMAECIGFLTNTDFICARCVKDKDTCQNNVDRECIIKYFEGGKV